MAETMLHSFCRALNGDGDSPYESRPHPLNSTSSTHLQHHHHHSTSSSHQCVTDNTLCIKCCKRRTERKEIITEIMETELKYGRDLRIIVEEFYRPMLVAGLLTSGIHSHSEKQASKVSLHFVWGKLLRKQAVLSGRKDVKSV